MCLGGQPWRQWPGPPWSPAGLLGVEEEDAAPTPGLEMVSHTHAHTCPHSPPPPYLARPHPHHGKGGLREGSEQQLRGRPGPGGHAFPQKKEPKTWVLGASLPGAQLTAAPSTARSGGPGNIKTLGDAYEFAVDVSDFSPEDIIVTTSNNHIEVRAEKVSQPLPLGTQAPHLHPRPAPTFHPGTPDAGQCPPTPTPISQGKLETLLLELVRLRAHYCRCRPKPDPFFRSRGSGGSHRGREGTVEVEGCGQGPPEG